MTYRLSRQALADLDQIAEFLLLNFPNTAPDVEATLRHLFGLLAQFPRLGRQGPRPGTREIPVRRYPYVIIFQERDGLIEILRVYHTSRDPERKLD